MRTHSKPTVGVSSGILPDKLDLEKLMALNPSLVEFYNYSTPEIPAIEEFCARNHVKASLHVPTPYDEPQPLQRFCPTGPTHTETMLAIKLTADTIRLANKINATHVVVHFPTPYDDAPSHITDEHISGFFDPVTALADELNVQVVVENMSMHPTFYAPEDYLKVLNRYPNLRMCMDVGHAYMLRQQESVYEFLEKLAPYIFAVHIYGLEKTATGYVKTFFQPKEQAAGECMEIGGIVKKIKALGIEPLFILELPVCQDGLQRAVESKLWLEDLLR
jgi:sugar phosphate isomerase/epimerase